jgi:hypothetical protein
MLTLIGLPLSVVYAIIEWDVLIEGEGWGVVFMVGLWGIFAVGLLLDVILQFIMRDKKILNSFEVILIVIFLIVIFF